MRIFRSWKFWVGFIISAACIVFAFWGIDWHAFLDTFKQISWGWFAIALLWVVPVLWVRAYRWKLLTGHLKAIKTYSLFQSLSIGFAVNNLLPARLGELARSYALSKTQGLRFSGVFATVVAERIYDSLSFTTLFVVFLSFVDVPVFEKLGISQDKFTLGILLVLSLGVGFMLLLRFRAELVERLVRRLFGVFSKKAADRLADEVVHFSEGIRHGASARDILALAFTSFFIWVISIFQFWLAAGALGVDLGVSNSFMLMVAVLFGISVPTSPGYVGTYHFAARVVLQALGYAPELALSIAIVVHITSYIAQTTLGLWYLKSMGLKLRDVSEEVALGEVSSGAAETPVSGEDSSGVSKG